MRRSPARAAGALAAVAALAIAGPAGAQGPSDTAGKSTVEQTIDGVAPRAPGAFSLLRLGPGEPWVVRENGIGAARPGRERTRRSLAYFAQLTDFQLADEESPARVESTDPLGSAFTAAWRPQEAMVPHMTDESIRQVNAFLRSPVGQAGGVRARMGFAITTGDSADNQQRNETRWVVSLLEGGTVDPNSGSPDPAHYSGCPAGTPGVQEAARYTGFQDYDDYAESVQFFDPDQPAGPYASWPRYPGLMDRAQAPFVAEGLKVPSYVAFGNHDALVQGNEDANREFDDIATGCTKAFFPGQAPGGLAAALNPAFLTSDPSRLALVPPDPERQFVSKPQYKALHATGAQADGHGFGLVDPAEAAASRNAAGYYAWDPAPGMRFIAVDTVSEGGVTLPEGGSSDGNVDDPQFRWLERELRTATQAGKLIVAFAHHAPQSLTANVPDEVAAPCSSNDAHGHDTNPGCDLDPRDSRPVRLGPDLVALFQRFPNFIAYVTGHTHANDVTPFAKPGGGGFWGIRTAAEADWPHQNRLLEVMDNNDGTVSVFGTVLDHAAPTAIPPAGTPAGGLGSRDLAAIGRALGYNDPQNGGGTGEGDPEDRNVELLLRDPRPPGVVGAPGTSNCLDNRPPRVRLTRARASRRGISLRGTASDRGCGRGGRGRVTRVHVAVGRRVGSRCRYLRSSRRFGRRVPCRRVGYVRARGTRRWRLAFRRSLRGGRYFVRVRAVDSRGNVSRPTRSRRLRR